MINKKLLAAASIVAAISSSSAFAKTEGNYVGLDLIRTTVDHQYANANGADSTTYTKFGDNGIGFGLNYKYAFNFGGFFIAPGAFFENNNTKSTDRDDANVYLDNRYALKADLGYDITNDIATYFTNGVTRTDYKVDWSSDRKNNHKYGYFWGLGLAYNINKQLTANVEYNAQTVNLKTPRSNGNLDKIDTNISVIKLGLAYNF